MNSRNSSSVISWSPLASMANCMKRACTNSDPDSLPSPLRSASAKAWDVMLISFGLKRWSPSRSVSAR